MSNNDFSTFPSTKTEALAILYLQHQDLSDKTPADIAKLYDEACKEICEHYNSNKINNSKSNVDYFKVLNQPLHENYKDNF